jgi:hypothetical protein
LILCSTHYTDYFHKRQAPPKPGIPLPDLDEKVVISMQGGVIRWVIDGHHHKITMPQYPFSPLPPDPFASRGNLSMDDRLFGVSPATGRLLSQIPPATFLEKSREQHAKLREYLAEDNSADTRALRAIAKGLKGTQPIVIAP